MILHNTKWYRRSICWILRIPRSIIHSSLQSKISQDSSQGQSRSLISPVRICHPGFQRQRTTKQPRRNLIRTSASNHTSERQYRVSIKLRNGGSRLTPTERTILQGKVSRDLNCVAVDTPDTIRFLTQRTAEAMRPKLATKFVGDDTELIRKGFIIPGITSNKGFDRFVVSIFSIYILPFLTCSRKLRIPPPNLDHSSKSSHVCHRTNCWTCSSSASDSTNTGL